VGGPEKVDTSLEGNPGKSGGSYVRPENASGNGLTTEGRAPTSWLQETTMDQGT